MKRHHLLFAAALAASSLAAASVDATVLYDNGPYNGQVAAANIAGGNYAVDSFTIGASATVTGVDFVAWNYPTTATTASVDWAIYNGAANGSGAGNGTSGSLIANGTSPVTSAFLLINTRGYAVNLDSFAVTSTALASGIYSLVLANASPGSNISWDENFGPSTAAIHTNFAGTGPGPSEAFQILGAPTGGVPEPAAWALMLVGFGGLGAALRVARRHAAVTFVGHQKAS